jgi:3-hydroxyisobutyrate dehydrogenase
MIGNNMIGVAEALIYSHKAGIDIDKMIELLSGGAAGSFSLSALGPRMHKRDFDPGFYAEHFSKDLAIVLDEAKQNNLSLPGTALSHQLYKYSLNLKIDRY